jgi:hypothetical protein
MEAFLKYVEAEGLDFDGWAGDPPPPYFLAQNLERMGVRGGLMAVQ